LYGKNLASRKAAKFAQKRRFEVSKKCLNTFLDTFLDIFLWVKVRWGIGSDFVLEQLSTGRSIENLLSDFPYLEKEDILEAIGYAAWRMQEREIPFSIAI